MVWSASPVCLSSPAPAGDEHSFQKESGKLCREDAAVDGTGEVLNSTEPALSCPEPVLLSCPEPALSCCPGPALLPAQSQPCSLHSVPCSVWAGRAPPVRHQSSWGRGFHCTDLHPCFRKNSALSFSGNRMKNIQEILTVNKQQFQGGILLTNPLTTSQVTPGAAS